MIQKKYDFGGPAGNILLMIALPLTVYYLYFCVMFNGGHLFPFIVPPESLVAEFLKSIRPTLTASVIFFGWVFFQAMLQALVPGKYVEGVPLSDGSRLKYRMNGLVSFALTFVSLAVLYVTGIIDYDIIYKNFGSLISVMTISVFCFSFFLYAYGKKTGQVDRPSGSRVQEFFMGVSLNPRIPPVTGFDLKLFCEARPSLMGWLAVTLSFAGTQYIKNGTLTIPMIMVAAFQFIYIADYFWNEEAILTTTDVVHDKFGFMLAFGDLVWVPLTYSIQAFYLIEHTHTLPVWGIALILLLNGGGYYLFRAVNLQKHRFRTVAGYRIWGREPRFIETGRGTRLLVSGFWGWSRHFNYVGDIMMALAWCLPCLFQSPVPYFYVVYFTILLVHRERRDDRTCTEKYGAAWEQYKKRVPWRIVPFIY